MLKLFTPGNSFAERRYIGDLVFNRFLGLDVEICQHSSAEVVLMNEGTGRLVIDDSFFRGLEAPLPRSDKVPKLPLASWVVAESGLTPTLSKPELPVLFGNPLCNGSFLACRGNDVQLGIDVLVSAFFMLSRYEELVSNERDQYSRFPASASIAYKSGFLDRPIINEYLEVLWACLGRVWSGLSRRERSFRVRLTHDVDHPFDLRDKSLVQMVRRSAGDIVRQRPLLVTLAGLCQWRRARSLGASHDPAYTFAYIMELAERHGLTSSFYFIPSRSAGPPDYRYGVFDPDLQALFSAIHQRGHEIGYHASIDTFLDPDLMQSEVSLLRAACLKAGAGQPEFGSRQHYLRIQVPTTLKHLAAAGLRYDSSLGFADHAGFRCGTCWEYPFYDIQARTALPIVERPLIVMECSVIDPKYMGMGTGPEALNFMLRLANECRRFKGDFTLLWHNNRLMAANERCLFEELIGRAVQS